VDIDLNDPKLQNLLSMPVPTLLCRHPRTARYRVQIYGAGIRTIRDLLSMPADELFRRHPTTPGNKAIIRRTLKEFGLDLDRVPARGVTAAA
jgi:hypothetical protein